MTSDWQAEICQISLYILKSFWSSIFLCLKFQNRYIYDHINERWGIHDENKDQMVTWDEYLQTSYGAIGERAHFTF